METEKATQNGSHGEATTVDVMTKQVSRLQDENDVLRNWVVGILEGCEGCIEEATGWAKSVTVVEEGGHK
ncbi:MAG: hypothetical protein R3330_04220 [Saprospiraceae bacterium]|nr:hypothetical protein [Saprospiraceae bacterium]